MSDGMADARRYGDPLAIFAPRGSRRLLSNHEVWQIVGDTYERLRDTGLDHDAAWAEVVKRRPEAADDG